LYPSEPTNGPPSFSRRICAIETSEGDFAGVTLGSLSGAITSIVNDAPPSLTQTSPQSRVPNAIGSPSVDSRPVSTPWALYVPRTVEKKNARMLARNQWIVGTDPTLDSAPGEKLVEKRVSLSSIAIRPPDRDGSGIRSRSYLGLHQREIVVFSCALDVLAFALDPGISDVEHQGENHDQGCERQDADRECTKKLL
jgi:hypothetical protein